MLGDDFGNPRCLRVSGSPASSSPLDRQVRSRHQAAAVTTNTSDGSDQAGRREGKQLRGAVPCLSPPIHWTGRQDSSSESHALYL